MDCPGLSFIIFGPSKSGKTQLSNTAPAPRLILDAEGGTRFLKGKKIEWKNPFEAPPEYDGSWETCIVHVRDYGTLSHVFQWLSAGKHPFRSVIIDSLSEVQSKCADTIAGVDALRIQDWGTLARQVSSLVRQYRDLLVHPSNPLDCIVYVAMAKQNNEGKWTPYVQGQLATTLPYYVDGVYYLKAEIKEEGFTNYLLTQPHVAYDTGDRSGVFDPIITNPDLTTMMEQFCEEINKENN